MNDLLNAWQAVLTSDYLLTDTATLSTYEQATFSTTQRVYAVLRPETVGQVQECLKIANQYKTPLYPISRGKNWGLGSRVPVQDNCTILDLSRINRIIDYNEKLAYITIQPGVTFRQVYEFLKEQNSKLFISVIGGSPEASVIGNTLERGDGSGPLGERVAHVCNFEIILPTGECIHTDFGRFANASAKAVNRWGVGPALDGLFSQSNLGIVTQMTVWLTPLPKFFQTFNCVIQDSGHLSNFIDKLQPLILQDAIRSNCFTFWNSYKFLARQGRYPWQIMGEKTPLCLKELKRFERWLGTGCLYSASREQGLAIRKLIEETFTGQVESLSFMDQDNHNDLLINNSSLGVPTDQNIRSTYWRKKTSLPQNINPDRDLCGVVWLCPILPFDGQVITQAIYTIETTVNKYGFEPNIAISCISGRSVQIFIAIMFDRDVPFEDERAMSCHDHLLQLLTQDGHIPYRLGIQSMNSLPRTQDDYGKLMQTLKQTLDPNDILAPGRYDFRKDWA
ncbi:4-cresol dehydrogenase [Dulcicalothrix desertica PCC 7102]|uniref:4-cresol dehydrogenase n=1 Tax=Dulcicalothrix desertica PCC 7102 TaxID=232991 RepID=A0A433ULK2_9CYAN|nr:FAD-binding oxidoreductase [Dulcicalothrix desertica]RUS94720.1 4-cresol dehydrogenase [Dulcicalothrix desertica PCC 7102]TWH51325.1 4-cresol dehydrogenase (hydroxylating) [Dulcicalothrix desertica PCC 7102]